MEPRDARVLWLVFAALGGAAFDVVLAVSQSPGHAPTVGSMPFGTWGFVAGLIGCGLLGLAMWTQTTVAWAFCVACFSAVVTGVILFTSIGPYHY